MTTSVIGRFTRQHQRKGYAAVVTLTVDPATETCVVLDCHGEGFLGQGYIEDVPEHGRDDWKQDAVAGVIYALDVAACGPRHVVITKIEGLMTDTNPTIVAAATMNALWTGIGFTPPSDVAARVTAAALDSWNQLDDAIPVFSPRDDTSPKEQRNNRT